MARQEVVPAAWVRHEARQTANGSTCRATGIKATANTLAGLSAYRATFGQFCLVMPGKMLIAIIRQRCRLKAILSGTNCCRLIAGPLPADDANNAKLNEKLGKPTRSVRRIGRGEGADGIAGKTYQFPANDQKIEALTLESSGQGGEVTLVCRFNGKPDQRIPCGNNEWKRCRVAFGNLPEQAAAVSGAWTNPDTYTAKICFNETPYLVTATLKFAEGKLRFNSAWNVSFRAARNGELIGEVK